MFLDNTNQEMGQNNEKFTDSLKIQLVLIIFKTYFKKNYLTYESLNLDSYLDGKDTNINIKIITNCDSTSICPH